MPYYKLQTIRLLALYTQGLTTKQPPTADSILSIVQANGCIQIDTLQMVQRSHYLTLWSRLGNYDTQILDQLTYGSPSERQLFEYWYHAACIIPLTEYRYRLPIMKQYQENQRGWHRDWHDKPENRLLMQQIYHEIHTNGAKRSADFKRKEDKGGTWWAWKPAKIALESLYNQGDLMIADRVNFQRVYDIRERVLPNWVDTTEPTEHEMHRHLIEHASKALGICQPIQTADYTHMKRTIARPVIEELINEGILIKVYGQITNDNDVEMVIHRDNQDLLQKCADGEIQATHTTFLSPFDTLFYPQKRDIDFWGFNQTLEAYKRAEDRQWGYFCLPILHKDQLIGRFDPKLDRKNGILHLKALYLEPNKQLSDEIIADVAVALKDFMQFHQVTDINIEKSEPPEFAQELLKLL